MREEIYPTALIPMIERARSLTGEQISELGRLWEVNAGDVPARSLDISISGTISAMVSTNEALVDGWKRTLEAAGRAERSEALEAALSAGRAIRRVARSQHVKPGPAALAEEAVRAAVLAVGMRDLLSDEDYKTLVMPWKTVLGAI